MCHSALFNSFSDRFDILASETTLTVLSAWFSVSDLVNVCSAAV